MFKPAAPNAGHFMLYSDTTGCGQQLLSHLGFPVALCHTWLQSALSGDAALSAKITG